jgi:hypothetical protein
MHGLEAVLRTDAHPRAGRACHEPPGCANAEEEAAHGLIEAEFCEREQFRDRKEFRSRLWTCQRHFSFTRTNSYRHRLTPVRRPGHGAAPHKSSPRDHSAPS